MSLSALTTAIPTKNGKKGERVQCYGCEEILEADHSGKSNKSLE